jgi:hypothetical protein
VGLGFGCGSIPRLRFNYDRPVPEKEIFLPRFGKIFRKRFRKSWALELPFNAE